MRLLPTLAIAVLLNTSASALDYKDLAGRWCVAGLGVIEFTPKEMILSFETGERRVFTVDEYREDGDRIVVDWSIGQKKDFTAFGNLRSGGTQITQLETNNGPAREMARCFKAVPTKPSP